MSKCKDAAPVGTRVIKHTFVERNWYHYPTEVNGKVVAYTGHVGPGFHFYKVKFEKPVYDHRDDLVVEVGEYDLVFPDGESEAEQAKKIMAEK